MELKTKYQYSYFIYPYTVDENKYYNYILKLLKNKKCEFRIFEKEKDLDIYNYFLPDIRNYLFPTFEYRDKTLKEFEILNNEKKARVIANQQVSYFSYKVEEGIKGKVGNEDGILFDIEKIEIICFKSGICFFTMKTILNNTDEFSDLLNFNYRFKEVNSEFYSLKNFENIKIQTDSFNEIKDISDLIYQITGVYNPKKNKKQEDLVNSQFYTFSYLCLENSFWNEKNNFSNIENNFYKYANVLPSNYSSDFNKENLEFNFQIVDRLKYSKIGLTTLSSNLISSGVDIYNFTKLPYEYENQYFYTYILTLYKKMFMRRINLEFKNFATINSTRNKFMNFVKDVWNKEITNNEDGNTYYKSVKRVLELDEEYAQIEQKYEIIYKDMNIEKNNKYSSIIILLLIFSLIFNAINIIFIMYLKM